MSVKIVKDDRAKLDKIIAQIYKMQGIQVCVGTFSDVKRKDGKSMAMIAATHEYGSTKMRIPRRSWHARWTDEKSSQINNFILRCFGEVVDLKNDSNTALKKIGAWAVGELKKSLLSIPGPALAFKTKARKKSTKILVDTGQLVNSQRYKIRKEQ